MDDALKQHLRELLGTPLKSCKALSGGDISSAYLLETATDRFFVKLHSGKQSLEMFRAEKEGLEAIARTGHIKTPAVYHCLPLGSTCLLLMEYIPSKNPSPAEMRRFGQALAAMHRTPLIDFGWENDNFIGSLPQGNTAHPRWSSFYVRERLLPQLRMAVHRGLMGPKEIPGGPKMEGVLHGLCGPVQPALLHGDLWAGNYLVSPEGLPCLIDPAVYRGHSEVDLAMSRLFGGFSPEFYQGYDSVLPPVDGQGERRDLYQLYYLLVHLNLFGKAYYTGVKQLLERYFGKQATGRQRS